jgi:hypothetical protein
MTGAEFRAKFPGSPIYQLPVAFVDSNDQVTVFIEEDCAERRGPQRNPGCTLWLPFGDIGGGRNIQFGRKTDQAGDLNLDMGAGSAQDRGIIGANYDIGRGVDHYDGRKRLIYRDRGYDEQRKNYAQFAAPLRLDAGLFVKSGTGYRRVNL